VSPRFRAVAIAAIALALIATGWILLARRVTESPVAAVSPQLALATAREGVVRETVALAGRVGPPAGTQTKLAFSVPGSLESVDVRLGEHVDPGESLARLDPTSYALAAQQAQAEAGAATQGAALAGIDRVSVKLRVDEAALARQERLYRAGVVALRDVQAAQAGVAADRADAQSARVQLAQAQAQARAAAVHAAGAAYDQARTILRAPSAGTVVGVFVQRGQTVDAGTPVVALSADRQGVATLDVPVDELGRIQTGDSVELHSSSASWHARIEGIATAVDPATGLAIVSVSGVPAGTPAGTPVNATVAIGEARGLVIPVVAIVEDPQSGAQLVFVSTRDRNGQPRFAARRITVDVRDDRLARVTAGLRAGEVVAAQGAIDLLAPPTSQ
jgi:RND family efflux transporter MFP subunit